MTDGARARDVGVMLDAHVGAMRPESGTRSAVLLLRVWQDGAGGGIRARLLAGEGSEADLRTVATVAGVDGIVGAVVRWLDAFSATTA